MRILIAEDQPTAALLLRRQLERLGHEIEVAPDGESAWEAIRTRGHRLVISDWMMPGLDGPGLCQRLRASPDAPYTYVILLTTREGRGDRLAGLHAGADDFLTKPPDPEELSVRLEVAGRILTVHERLERQNAQLAELAQVDGLTGLLNARAFRERLDRMAALASRTSQPIAMVMMDVDHFKSFNDSFGHPSGDEALRDVGRILREELRAQDAAGRLGGEEFGLALPATSLEEAAAAAERLRRRLLGHPWPLRPMTASFGVAACDDSDPAVDPAALIRAADQALYRAKRSGRDRVCTVIEAATSGIG